MWNLKCKIMMNKMKQYIRIVLATLNDTSSLLPLQTFDHVKIKNITLPFHFRLWFIVFLEFNNWPKQTLSYKLHVHLPVLQIPAVILSHCASGHYQITATKVTGQWRRHSNQTALRRRRCLRRTTQWEALMVRVQKLSEEEVNECFRILFIPFYPMKHIYGLFKVLLDQCISLDIYLNFVL